MHTRGRLLATFTTAALVLVLPGGAGASASRDARPVFQVPSFTPVPHAQSTLVRLDGGIAFSLETSQLDPSAPATLLLVIFNQPSGCSHGEFGLRCGEGDVTPGGPAQPSVVVVSERQPAADGQFAVGGSLGVAVVDNAVFGPGLTNPSGADIHLVVQQSGSVVQASPHEA